MNQKHMRIALACTDQDTVWAIDMIIHGLYFINKKTFETKCVIDSKKLFYYERFVPHGLFKWEEDYIVIVPQELHKMWVIYNKSTGQIQYKRVVEVKCQGTFIGIDEVKAKAYFCPITKKDPIIIVDLEKFVCTQVINVLGENVSDSTIVWRGICNEKYILFPLRGERYIMRLNFDSSQVNSFESEITEGIADVDFYSDELWVLPMEGEKIYKINEEGKKIASVELMINHQNISASEFSRIVVQKKYIFLLPYHQQGIYVYDKLNKRMFKIAEENDVLPDTIHTIIRYWGYYIDNNQICLLPSQNKYLQIDLDSLYYKQKDLCYPSEWGENNEIYYCIWNHVFEINDCMLEKDSDSQKSFFIYIQNEKNQDNMKIDMYYGEKIWKALCRINR